MIEIKNKTRSPVQVIVKSSLKPGSLTTLNIPGIGAGKNIYLLEDERATDYIDRLERDGLITTRKLSKKQAEKGE